MKKPRYTHSFIDRHGKPRFYFRRRGFKQVPLRGIPWSPQFMADYEAAAAGQSIEIGVGRTKPGSLHGLAVSYFGSIAFRSMKPSTQRVRRNIIERLCEQTDREGNTLGDKSAATLQREHVVKLIAARAVKPESANGLRKALRAIMRHAIEIGLRDDDPTRDVRGFRVNTSGIHSWTDDEIAQFEGCHPVGSRARLAMALLLFTGQRRSDVVRMGRQHMRDGAIHVRQQKTAAELAIPVHPTLANIIAGTPKDDMTFLTTHVGRPFSAAGFGNWFRARCNEAGLRHCSAHGLRKAAARRLAEAGATAHEIAAITGHATLREVARYTMAADQKRLALAAMAKVKT